MKGDAKTRLSDKQGIYISQPDATVNGETYWTHENGQFALWYIPKGLGGLTRWIIGKRKALGQRLGFITSPDDTALPQAANTWDYFDGKIWKSNQTYVTVTGILNSGKNFISIPT